MYVTDECMYRRNHDPAALWLLQQKYLFGRDSISVDIDRSCLSLRAAAESGHKGAQFFWAMELHFGDNGIIVDLPNALAFYEHSGLAGYILGRAYELGWFGLEPDQETSLLHYRAGALVGDIRAQDYLGKVYEMGLLGTTVNFSASLTHYETASTPGAQDLDNPFNEFIVLPSLYEIQAESEERLARAYEEGELGLTVDKSRAFGLYYKAAFHGNLFAMLRLADAYEDGDLNNPIDLPGALKYRTLLSRVSFSSSDDWKRSIVRNANFRLGNVYEYGDLNCKTDLYQAKHHYETAHKLNDFDATCRIAEAIIDGELNYTYDPKRALSLLEEAAAGEHGGAQVLLSMVLDGIIDLGATIDEIRAVQLCLAAATSGDLKAKLNMGIYLVDGAPGCEVDVVRAREFIDESVAGGLADALAFLAIACEFGSECGLFDVIDIPRALDFYERAAQDGDLKSILRLSKACYYGQLGMNIDKERSLVLYQKSARIDNSLGCPLGHALQFLLHSDPREPKNCALCAYSCESIFEIPTVKNRLTCSSCAFDLCASCSANWSAVVIDLAVRAAIPSSVPSDFAALPRLWSITNETTVCPNGCYLVLDVIPRDNFKCDKCSSHMPCGTETFACRKCNYDMCTACEAVSPQPVFMIRASDSSDELLPYISAYTDSLKSRNEGNDEQECSESGDVEDDFDKHEDDEEDWDCDALDPELSVHKRRKSSGDDDGDSSCDSDAGSDDGSADYDDIDVEDAIDEDEAEF